VTAPHTLEGLLVDPLDGPRTGRLTIEDGLIVSVEEDASVPREPVVFPGFVDLQVYAPEALLEQGVTAYLLATRAPVELPDECCLGLHLEGPFLNPNAAGAVPLSEIEAVDLERLRRWLEETPVRLVTVAPEIPRGLDAIALVAEHAVAAVGHTRANAATVRAAVDAGARFATHLWNAMQPLAARETGPVAELLLEPRVVLGLIADGRHLHPRIEQLTIQVAGAERIALTSDLVAEPVLDDNRLAGGDRAGAALVRRMARYGLREAATMASLVPARLLGLADRGRVAAGHRADLAVLGTDLRPLETLVAGETAWSVRYPQTRTLDDLPPSTHAPGSGA
jgi:N-acetylglucosamine-6-phosphate deacetylase